MTEPFLDYEALLSWITEIFQAAGVANSEARITASLLVQTEARGFRTHGLARVASYVDKIVEHEIDPRAELIWTRRDNVITCEANRALGQVAGSAAVAAAIELAQSRPLVACQVRNMGHLGALGVIALRAAEQGLIGILLQATPPVMSLPGAKAPSLGNNPFAFAAPRPDGPPLVIDMACSVAARGNILLAARTGEAIPDGWALDVNGAPTTEANRALDGMLLPFGGHKGFAVAMIVETLAASLTGAAVGSDGPLGKRGGKASNALLLVLNPDHYGGRRAYEEHIRHWTTHIRRTGAPGQAIPGERADREERQARMHGLMLSPTIRRELADVGHRLSVGSDILG
jgi:LDH2 family malate/lactate/ureidoglycolate dehydrogenase